MCFPNSLVELSFGDLFDQSLDSVELQGLQHLSLGQGWNQGLEGLKLPQLQSLLLGDGFNQSLERVQFPGSLRKLLGFEFFFLSVLKMRVFSLGSLRWVGNHNQIEWRHGQLFGDDFVRFHQKFLNELANAAHKVVPSNQLS